MSSLLDKSDRDTSAPFLVQLFFRNGGFHRPEEFASSVLPPSISVYTWPSCTLNELALELAASKSSALPHPSIGTRLAFQLVCPDLRGSSGGGILQPRFAVKELGSIVIGDGGPGIDDLDDIVQDSPMRDSNDARDKTLAEARFVVGDYISCAILPPLVDGSIAPNVPPPRSSTSGRDSRGGFHGGFPSHDDGVGRNNGRQGRGSRRDIGGFPLGEWRRGEKLPDAPGRFRGRGRW